jgi:hypothetical protein
LRRALQQLRLALELLAELERSQMPLHYRQLLIARRVRGSSITELANKYRISEQALHDLLRSAEAWLRSNGRSSDARAIDRGATD